MEVPTPDFTEISLINMESMSTSQ